MSKVHADLIGETDLIFTSTLPFANTTEPASNSPLGDGGIDVLFLCTGHGEAKKFLEANAIPAHIKIIDLSNDFRLANNADVSAAHKRRTYFIRNFIYGLPELNKEAIKTAHNIANPGCFATAIQLGLLPLAKAGLLTEIYTTGITGSTGAGQSLSATSHFSWRANNIQAYKTLNAPAPGRNCAVACTIASQLSSSPFRGRGISFVPWRGDFTRGIFISSTIQTDISLSACKAIVC